MTSAWDRGVCCHALLAALLLVLLLTGPARAYPSRFAGPPGRLEAAKRANSRGTIRVQPKADRFYLGPRFGKRSEVADYGEVAGATEENGLPEAFSEEFSLRCSQAGPERLFRCHLEIEPLQVVSE